MQDIRSGEMNPHISQTSPLLLVHTTYCRDPVRSKTKGDYLFDLTAKIMDSTKSIGSHYSDELRRLYLLIVAQLSHNDCRSTGTSTHLNKLKRKKATPIDEHRSSKMLAVKTSEDSMNIRRKQ